jgi:hypothetical protein
LLINEDALAPARASSTSIHLRLETGPVSLGG